MEAMMIEREQQLRFQQNAKDKTTGLEPGLELLQPEEFNLVANAEPSVQPTPELELLPSGDLSAPHQTELDLSSNQTANAELPQRSQQIEFSGMEKPVYAINIAAGEQQQQAKFQHANTLLESLEAQNIDVHYQCREGYCGSCRVELESGKVHYREEPMAWLNDNEILPCCCIPKSDLQIKKP